MLYLSGPVLCSLMRRHRCPIRLLAQRMAISMRRIRQVRQAGLPCPHAARDWVEAITGHDPGPVTRPIPLTKETSHHA
jgi:hypothetical protein